MYKNTAFMAQILFLFPIMPGRRLALLENAHISVVSFFVPNSLIKPRTRKHGFAEGCLPPATRVCVVRTVWRHRVDILLQAAFHKTI